MPTDPHSDEVSQTYRSATDSALGDMRSSAKWLLGAFATTGAVVFAGIQLTSLKDLGTRQDSWRLPVAMLGFLMVIAGIIMAVAAIGRFLRRFPVTAKDLASKSGRVFDLGRESVDHDPTILGEYPDFPALWSAYLKNIAAIHQMNAGPEPIVGTYGDQTPLPTERLALNRAIANSKTMVLIMGRALTRASFVITSERYRAALMWVGIGAGVAAIGGLSFAVAVAQLQPSTASLPTLVRPATQVDISILPESPHRTQLASVLGPECDLNALKGVVLEQEGADTFNVAFFGSHYCRSSTFLLGPIDAVVRIQN